MFSKVLLLLNEDFLYALRLTLMDLIRTDSGLANGVMYLVDVGRVIAALERSSTVLLVLIVLDRMINGTIIRDLIMLILLDDGLVTRALLRSLGVVILLLRADLSDLDLLANMDVLLGLLLRIDDDDLRLLALLDSDDLGVLALFLRRNDVLLDRYMLDRSEIGLCMYGLRLY